jgi:hypothetical protein
MQLIEEEYHCFRCIRYTLTKHGSHCGVEHYGWYVRKACDNFIYTNEDSDEAYLGLMGYLRCF